MKSVKKPVFLFDLDGTITKQELLPLISRLAGIEEEMTVLTNETMLGKLPFEESFRMRVNMLKQLDLKSVHKAVESVELDTNFLNFINENNDVCAVVTGNLDAWIDPLVKKYHWKCYSSVANIKRGKIIDVSLVIDKKDVLGNYSDRLVVAVGDGMNDYDLLKNADLSFVFGNPNTAPSILYNVADYYCMSSETICRIYRSKESSSSLLVWGWNAKTKKPYHQL